MTVTTAIEDLIRWTYKAGLEDLEKRLPVRTISILYDRLICLRVPCAEARAICADAVRQIHESGRFAVEAHGGWILGRLTVDGVILGVGA